MKKPDFLAKLIKEEKLKLTEPSQDIYISYLTKSGNCLSAAKILLRPHLFENSVSEAYYAMYNCSLSLLFKCGIKCENHTAAFLLLDRLFGLKELSRQLESAKKERIDKQYYVSAPSNTVLDRASTEEMIKTAEDFVLALRAYAAKVSAEQIARARKDFLKLAGG